jgi:hypothetical protein
MSTITSKQDCGYVRTAQDLERKYKFGETFADMIGLINDNRDKVDSVESSLLDEIGKSTTLARTAEDIALRAEEKAAKVEMNLSADAVDITVKRVETETGFVFDDKGLNVSKSGEAMSNQLTHEGMYVKKSGDEVMVADKDGVKAWDLHAKTYLIVGEDKGRSRFEDYEIDRTACFWIGG